MKSSSVNDLEFYIWIQMFLIWLRFLGVIEWPWYAVLYPLCFFALEVIGITIWVIIKHLLEKKSEGG